MKITDAVSLLDGARTTNEGYLEANARTARTGVQVYRGDEVGRPEVPRVAVYRDEAEVFHRASLETFSKLPITVDHPAEPLSADTWRQHAVGTTGDEVLRDGDFLKIGLKITDAAAVDAIRAGKRELSVGYMADLEWTDGTAPDGTPYQARQTGIVANHIAIVDRARAGQRARIGDGAASWGAAPLTEDAAAKEGQMPDLRKVMVDGLEVETTDQGAAAIAKLQKDAEAIRTDHADVIKAKDEAIATKDGELAKKDAEIDDLKGKILDDAALDAKVQARADLIGKAKSVAKDVKTDGLSDADIRKATVAAVLGDKAVEGKAGAYIDARFDILVEDGAAAGGDPLKGTTVHSKDTGDDLVKAYADRNASLRDAWSKPIMQKEA